MQMVPCINCVIHEIDLADTQQIDNGMDLDSNITEEGTARPQPIQHIDRMKKATRTSARHLQEVSFTRAYMRAREKRFGQQRKKKKEPKGKQRAEVEGNDISMEADGEGGLDDEEELDDEEGLEGPSDKDPGTPSKTVSDHMKAISEPKNSPMAARTLEDVARISALRREASEPIRTIQSNKRLQNLHHTQEIQKKRSKTKAAAKLKEAIEDHSAHPDPPIDKINQVNGNNGYCQPCRRHHPPTMCNHLIYPSACPKSKPDNITVFAYGAAGSGVGSRISGHLRWGGNWMREELLRLGLVVALTDEYCTSKTCVYCFERLKFQKSRRLVGTTVKTKSVHGSVVCVNPECPAVMAGYATRPRDTNAAVGILLSAASVMLNEDENAAPWPLLPYSRYARPRSVPTINTGAQDPDKEQTSCEQIEVASASSAIMAAVGRGQTTRYVAGTYLIGVCRRVCRVEDGHVKSR